jgi:steroid delta-isomerase-like uncharacterized protein
MTRVRLLSISRRGEVMGNSDTMLRMLERISATDVDGFCDGLADDFVEHETGPGMEPTKAGTRQLFSALMASYRHLRIDSEDIIDSGEKVAVRVRITGTNKNDFMGIPASGKRIDEQGIDIVRFGDDGLAHEHWGVMDMMSLMQQIGAIPSGPPPA